MANKIDVRHLRQVELKDTDGPGAVLAKDGTYALLIKEVRTGTAKDSGNATLGVTFVVQDEDEKGKVLYRTYPITGEVQSGEFKGTPNIDALGKLLISTGRPQDFLASLASRGEVTDEELVKFMTEAGFNIAYAYVKQKRNNQNGEIRSEVMTPVRKEKYEERRKSGTQWRNAPSVTAPVTPGGAPAGGVTGPANGVAGPARQAVATDQMAADV